MNDIVIKNGCLVLPEEVLPGGVVRIKDGLIKSIDCTENSYDDKSAYTLDAGGRLVMPGFIDLHSDAIENEIEPRPKGYLPHHLAFRELERKIAGQGITTMFHSISLTGSSDGVRCSKTAEDIVHGIRVWPSEKTLVRHRLHLRFEVTNIEGVETAIRLIEKGFVHLVSVMDHTPGQGQYRTDEQFRDYVRKTKHLSDEEIERIIALRREGQNCKWQIIERLANAARRNNVPMASHDDDCPAQVERLAKMGVTISDFPVSLKAARSATILGHYVCVGAPNVVRRRSVSGNLSALEAVKDGAAQVLCSDYYPASILHAVFLLVQEGFSLPWAVKMAAYNPAVAVGLRSAGTLEAGKQADLVIIDSIKDVPTVVYTIVNGCLVYAVDYQSSDEIS